MEIGRFVRDPAEKADDLGVIGQSGRSRGEAGKFRIAEMDMDCPMADRVKGNGIPSALAARTGMVVFDPSAQRAIT